jgi:hypothetical protein
MPSPPRPGPPTTPPSSGGRTTPNGKRGRLASTALTASEFFDHADAFHFAAAQGTPLNTDLTICAQGSPVYGEGRSNKANTKRFTAAIESALEHVASRFGLTPAYTIVLENPPCGGPGLHAHVGLGGPTDDADHALFRQSLASTFQRRFRWSSKREGPYAPLKIEPARLGATNAHRASTYHRKGCDDATAHAMLSTPKPWGAHLDPILRERFDPKALRAPQGTIHGPRIIVAPSIDREARWRAGYADTCTLADPIRPLRDQSDRCRARIRALSETQLAPAACLTGPGGATGHSATSTPSATGTAAAQPPGECSAAASATDRIGRHFGSARSPWDDMNVCISSPIGRSGIFVPEQHRRRKAHPMQTGPPSLDEYADGDSLVPEGTHFDPERYPQAPALQASTKLASALNHPSTGFLGAFLERALLDQERQRAEAAENHDTL